MICLFFFFSLFVCPVSWSQKLSSYFFLSDICLARWQMKWSVKLNVIDFFKLIVYSTFWAGVYEYRKILTTLRHFYL